MDLTDPKVWADGAKLVIEAPQITLPLIAVVAVGTWWLRGRIERGAREGLEQQRDAQRTWRELAEAKATNIGEKLETATAELAALKSKVEQGQADNLVLAQVNATAASLGQLRIANNSLIETLRSSNTGGMWITDPDSFRKK